MKKSMEVNNSMHLDDDPVKTVVESAVKNAANVTINLTIKQTGTQVDESNNLQLDVMNKPVRNLDDGSSCIIDSKLCDAVDKLLLQFPESTLIDISRAFVMACYRKKLPSDKVALLSGYSRFTTDKFRRAYTLSEK